MEEFLLQVAHGAVAVLVALLAVYLSLKLLGKIAKFVIGAVLVALVLWFLLSDNSIMQTVKDLIPVTLPWQKGA
jgi:hypothetical protein